MDTPVSVPSRFERVLVEGGHDFVEQFFANWGPELIFRTSRANFLLTNLIKGYVATTWDLQTLLSRWVSNVDKLLETLDSTGSFVCGPVAANFFSRERDSYYNIDICASKAGFEALVMILDTENYIRTSPEVIVSSFQPTISEKVFTLRFRHDSDPIRRSITFHVVRGKPLDFLIGCASSTSH